MKHITKDSFLNNKEFYLSEMREGKIFIYPTDTVLGIGCIVTDSRSVCKIFELKQRENKPLLIIIPNINWLNKYSDIRKKHFHYISEKLPGRYSFVVNLKDTKSIDEKIHNNLGSVGVRIPDNWFAQIIGELGEAFITTSVNISGEPSVLDSEDIPNTILGGVDYVIKNDESFLGKSSRLIDMRNDEMKILRK